MMMIASYSVDDYHDGKKQTQKVPHLEHDDDDRNVSTLMMIIMMARWNNSFTLFDRMPPWMP